MRYLLYRKGADMNTGIRTEHSGGKNGGGYYGRRVEAKAVSRKLRRETGKRIVREGGE